MHWWSSGFWQGGSSMIFGWIALLIAIVFLVRLLWPTGAATGGQGSERPLDILQRRYAQGELGREEYLRMREDLMKH